MNNEHMKVLDGFRGLGAIVVLFCHFCQIFLLPIFGLDSYIRYAISVPPFYLVCMFFSLSGYVIVKSISSNFNRYGYFNYRVFMISRIARIYPAFVFALILSGGVYLLANTLSMHGADSFRLDQDLYVAREKFDFSFSSYLGNLFFLHGIIPEIHTISNNGPLWSISFEFWIYVIVLAFSIVFFNTRAAFGYIILFVTFSTLFYFGNDIFLFYLYVWVLGAVCAIFEIMGRKISRLSVFCILFSSVIIVCFFTYKDFDVFGYHVLVPFYTVSSYYIQFFISLFVLFFFLGFNSVFRWMSSYANFGLFSYTLYVIHFPILLLFFSIFHAHFMEWNWWFRSAFCIFILVVIVFVSSRLSLFLENKNLFYRCIDSFLSRFFRFEK